jgi:hypothetical protein
MAPDEDGIERKGGHEAALLRFGEVFFACSSLRTAACVIGSLRTRTPTAFAIAGATTATAGSPQPKSGHCR